VPSGGRLGNQVGEHIGSRVERSRCLATQRDDALDASDL